METGVVKRGFGVGTLEVSFDEGLEEAIEMIEVTDTKNVDGDLLGLRKGNARPLTNFRQDVPHHPCLPNFDLDPAAMVTDEANRCKL